jgi:hypothetical protein
LCPAIRAGIPEFNRHYRVAQRDHQVFAVAQRRDRTWETRVGVSTEWGRPGSGYERPTGPPGSGSSCSSR